MKWGGGGVHSRVLHIILRASTQHHAGILPIYPANPSHYTSVPIYRVRGWNTYPVPQYLQYRQLHNIWDQIINIPKVCTLHLYQLQFLTPIDCSKIPAQKSIPRNWIDLCEKSIPLWNWFSAAGVGEELRKKGVYSLRGASNGWKVDSCFKKSHFMRHSQLDSILGSYFIPGIDFPPIALLRYRLWRPRKNI